MFYTVFFTELIEEVLKKVGNILLKSLPEEEVQRDIYVQEGEYSEQKTPGSLMRMNYKHEQISKGTESRKVFQGI